jgi:DNA-binding protein YbaB
MKQWPCVPLKFNTRSMVIEIKESLLQEELKRQVSNLIFEASNHARYDIFVDIDEQSWEKESALLHPEDRLVLCQVENDG